MEDSRLMQNPRRIANNVVTKQAECFYFPPVLLASFVVPRPYPICRLDLYIRERALHDRCYCSPDCDGMGPLQGASGQGQQLFIIPQGQLPMLSLRENLLGRSSVSLRCVRFPFARVRLAR